MIPLPTTTVTVTRPGSAEPYEAASTSTVLTSLRAHVSHPLGHEVRTGGSSEVVDAVLICDVADIRHGDTVTCDATGQVWRVEWARERPGLGLDHLRCGLRTVTGVAASRVAGAA